MARVIGDIMLNIDDDHLSEAETWIKKAIDTDIHNGTRWHLASDYALYADWFSKKGDASMAKENFQKAIDIFTESGADGWVSRTQKSLLELTS